MSKHNENFRISEEQMDADIERYNKAKENGTLDQEFPVIAMYDGVISSPQPEEWTLEEHLTWVKQEKMANWGREFTEQDYLVFFKDEIRKAEERGRESAREEKILQYVKQLGKDWELKPFDEIINMIRNQAITDAVESLNTFEIKEIRLRYNDNVKDTVREIVDMTLLEAKESLEALKK